MKDNLTQIAIVLDRSGSMATVRQATQESFEGFIKGQQSGPGDTNLLFVQFDAQQPYEIIFDGHVKDFKSFDFQPRGGTPLHDAIGHTVTNLGRKLANMPEDERPAKVMVVIVTDGQENSSTDFNQETIANLIKEQTEQYNWAFLFLAANQDAVLSASRYNISRGSALTYNSNNESVNSMAFAASSVVDLWKYSNAKPEFTEQDRNIVGQTPPVVKP